MGANAGVLRFGALAAPAFGGPEARTISEVHPLRPVARRDAAYRRFLAAGDLLAAGAALSVSLSVLGEDQMRPLAFLALPLVILVAKLQGLYERDPQRINKTTLDEAPQLFGLATLYTLILSIFDHNLILGGLSQRQTVGIWLLLFLFSIGGRALARMLARLATSEERCLVLGDFDSSMQLATKFAEATSIKATVVGRIPLDEKDRVDEGEVLARRLENLESVVRAHDIHRVVIAPHGTDSDQMLEAIRAAKSFGVQVSVLPRMLEVVGSSVEFDQLYGVTVLGVQRFGLTRSSWSVKRALDLFGGIVGLILVAPFMALIAAAIKLSSTGPVFFRQTRVGQNGELFRIFKFRTMVDGADAQKDQLRALNEAAEGLFKIASDPRITRVGGWLRRTSLDELPQLFNVLSGQMSLVGPRPLVEEEDRRIEGRHRRRLHLKPGMTGQWQIFGSSRVPLREMVNIDYLYVANWSIWNDVKILCRTVPYMLGRRGL